MRRSEVDRVADALRNAGAKWLHDTTEGYRDPWHDGIRLDLDDQDVLDALALAVLHSDSERSVAYQIGYRVLGPLSLLAALSLLVGAVALGIRWLLG